MPSIQTASMTEEQLELLQKVREANAANFAQNREDDILAIVAEELEEQGRCASARLNAKAPSFKPHLDASEDASARLNAMAPSFELHLDTSEENMTNAPLSDQATLPDGWYIHQETCPPHVTEQDMLAMRRQDDPLLDMLSGIHLPECGCASDSPLCRNCQAVQDGLQDDSSDDGGEDMPDCCGCDWEGPLCQLCQDMEDEANRMVDDLVDESEKQWYLDLERARRSGSNP